MWSIGLFTMWLASYVAMQRRGRHDVAGEYKAVLELGHAMYTQFADLDSTVADDKDISTLTEEQLRSCFTAKLHGGSISYQAPQVSSAETKCHGSGWGVIIWMKTEKWWLISLFLVCGGGIVLGYFGMIIYGWVLVGFTSAIPITVAVGSTGRSRGMLFFWLFWILTILPMGLIWVYTLFG